MFARSFIYRQIEGKLGQKGEMAQSGEPRHGTNNPWGPVYGETSSNRMERNRMDDKLG